MPPYHVAVLPGDGVGPEVVAEARKVVDVLALPISWSELDWGSDHYHRTGRMMPDDAIETVGRHDAVLMGAVGDPSVPDHVTLWGLPSADAAAARPVGERSTGSAARRGALPVGRKGPG